MSDQYPLSPTPARGTETRLPLPVVWLAVLACLYGLLLAVGLVGNGFKVASGGGDTAKSLFAFVSNPLAGLLLGIMATALVQSSSTVTAVIVGLVAHGSVDVPMAVPMIMGANLGTTVTNTIVCMAYMGRKVEFRRAFAAATVHDAFNVVAILIFLPLELLTGFLRHSAGWSASLLRNAEGGSWVNPVSLVTKPVERLIYNGEGKGLLGQLPFPSLIIGILIATIGLVLIFVSISAIGKMLKRVMQGRAERIFHAAVGRGPLAGIASGTVVTVLVQSSSTTTSLIVPMAGAGILKLEKIFPFTIGANIGTCVTALLASMAGGDNSALAHAALQIALVHLYFNLAATVVVMSIPWLRRLPIWAANAMAELAVRSRGMAIAYVLALYFGVPALILAVSMLFAPSTPESVESVPTSEPPASEPPASEPINTPALPPSAPSPLP